MKPFDCEKIKMLFLDMDGVLYHGTDPIGDLAEIFGKIYDAGLLPVFGTNNSSRTPHEYCSFLAKFGVHAEPEQFFTSGTASVYVLKRDFPDNLKLHVIGSDALRKTMQDQGITLVENHADAVLASIDKQLTYDKIALAMRNILEGAAFYGTNMDPSLLSENGSLPGSGVTVNALATCTGKQPFVVGKPNTIMLEMACAHYGFTPDQTLAIGDRYDTDILGGINGGAHTALVLTGFETRESIKIYDKQPELIFDDLNAAINWLTN